MSTLQAPKYARYRGKYARVTIDRKVIHLGEYGSEDSQAKYKRLVTQWACRQPVAEATDDSVAVADVLEAYREWARKHYGDVPRDVHEKV